MRQLTCIVSWLCLFAAAGPAAGQDGYEAGGWTVTAENFSNGERACVATAPGAGDPLYTFTLVGRDFIITVLSSRIDWRAGQTVSATLAVDGRWSRRMDVSADFPSLFFFEFPFDDEVVERLRDGQVFRVETARGTHKMNLSGSSAAFAALWACAGRSAVPGATAAAEPAAPRNGIIDFPAGSWQGIADLGDGSDVPLCTVFGPGAESGLLLNWSPSGLSIGLQDGGWSLTPGQRYPVTVSVDNRWRADLDARVLAENSVAIIIGDDRSAIDGLRLGSRLTISAAQQEFRFDLRGSGVAIGALRDCYRRYAGALADLPAIAVPDTVPRTPEAPPASAGAERGPELASGVYRRPMSLELSNVEGIVRTRISPSARVWQNQQHPFYYEFRGASGIRDNGAVFGKVMEVDVPSGLIEMAMTTLYAEEVLQCGDDGGESGRMPVEFYPDLHLQYALIRCGTNPGDRQVELVLMLIDTYGILYVIESGYADTIRMADLILAIQSVGRGEVQ